MEKDPLSLDDRFRFHESLPLAVALFGFWVILSGKLDLFHLGAGALASLLIATGMGRLYRLKPAIATPRRHPFVDMPWLRLILYLPWLLLQIAISSVQVAAIVLRPKMELEPQLFRFHFVLPHNMARATLANSITLTPGTVTLDVREDDYLVHALTRDAERSLQSDQPGNMKHRVALLFGAREQSS